MSGFPGASYDPPPLNALRASDPRLWQLAEKSDVAPAVVVLRVELWNARILEFPKIDTSNTCVFDVLTQVESKEVGLSDAAAASMQLVVEGRTVAPWRTLQSLGNPVNVTAIFHPCPRVAAGAQVVGDTFSFFQIDSHDDHPHASAARYDHFILSRQSQVGNAYKLKCLRSQAFKASLSAKTRAMLAPPRRRRIR